MNLIQASQLSEAEIAPFLKENSQIQKKSLIESGYVVKINDCISGCFQLEQVEAGVYWLKQLYISKKEAAKLPILLEVIITMAKKQQAKFIYAHSYQPVTDFLLESLQFNLQNEQDVGFLASRAKGNWWSYRVS